MRRTLTAGCLGVFALISCARDETGGDTEASVETKIEDTEVEHHSSPRRSATGRVRADVYADGEPLQVASFHIVGTFADQDFRVSRDDQ